ncbi:S8 family peptidase [Hyphobacterium sp. HN65]|uniref:S8 family peptidase n=1 Tax=Hyphobacterium lacteum TaxID=3116575 RepID=A0ABU7LN99_9PROT|nr:S8 family peptidase [Hyphobacterium sp. HN65]MEE2525091.1 S8 family peptidase [Hyphobacterium sp. HN65]
MKKFLQTTVALSALACVITPMTASTAFADGGSEENAGEQTFLFAYHGDINPFYGDISPFYGDINPFHGDINPFRGDINPFYGDISPFWGDISPFWGDINPFHGDINPFYGDISPFWGDISPFYGDIDPFYGDINPFYGDIAPFWGDIGPFWGDINAFWGDIDPFSETAADDYQSVVNHLLEIFAQADAVFGASVEHQTGQSLEEVVLADLLAKYGLDLSNPESLSELSAADRSAFFLDFYDGLMGYTGLDRVDHWMPHVNWTPALSQAAGAGEGVVVGLLDFSFTADEALNVRRSAGERDYLNFNHGAAVAGLINAPLDGKGVMGIAPGAMLVTYNPFDETLSTNFDAVTTGLETLLQSNARVINMSLGVPGTTFSQEWADVFSSDRVARFSRQALFVVAAGNDGHTQTFDVDWSSVGNVSNLIIVGSVDPASNISFFSNRPGEACFTVNGRCTEGNRLMDRFLVAPGELIMVSDGEGGFVRQSGTSFAAPLVSGAAALVQGRWGWLQSNDVADVLLRSARDLGEPGTDAVYGRGMLDIGAAMSPLDADSLYFVTGDMGRQSAGAIAYSRGRLTFHSRDENSVVLFEDINDTFRDFVVSLDDLNIEMTQEELDASLDAEAYLLERNNLADSDRDGTADFRDTTEFAVAMSARGNLRVSAFASTLDPQDRVGNDELGFQVGVRIADDQAGRELRFGHGEGALALSAQEGFGLFSDHRPETGGVNPVLGFASGGVYGMAGYEVSENTRVTFGATTSHDEQTTILPYSGEERSVAPGLGAYDAAAFSLTATHTVRDGLDLNVSYTLLREDTGFLGAQGTGPLDFSGGALTDAATFGVSAALPMQLNFDASATVGRTRTGGFGSETLSLSEDAISSAFQVTMTRQGVFNGRDALRFSVIQPLHIESGALQYSTARIADRETGKMTASTETWRLGGERPLYAEAMYGNTLFDGLAGFSLYSRVELAGDSQYEDFSGVTAGGRLTLEF